MILQSLHRTNGKILGVFIGLHLMNHAALLLGRETHLLVIEKLRVFYRVGVVEYLIFLLFAVQITLGIVLIARRGRPKGAWAWAQVVSGGYIAFFLLQHMSAVVLARMNYDFETTTYWAVSVVSRAPFVYYFFPYYVLAIMAIFTHVAAAARFAHWPKPAKTWHKALPLAGLLFGLAVVSAMSVGSKNELPQPYVKYLSDFYSG